MSSNYKRGGEDDTLHVDFNKLGLRTLKRYKRRFRLKLSKHNPTKPELVQAIQQHFIAQRVEEGDVLDFFLYAAKNLQSNRPLD